MTIEEQYLAHMRHLLQHGIHREGRNGGTWGLFGAQLRHDLAKGFPLLTTKKLPFRHIAAELFWFLSGSTNVKPLQEQGVTIWDEWADKDGELGPVYGAQWRGWPYCDDDKAASIDQIKQLIEAIKRDPYSRRHVVTAWNPAELDLMALPPCHILWQCHVAEGRLSLHLYQRSADWFLGVPFNIASYALLTHLLARETGYEPGELIMSFGDYHLYSNHIDQADMQLQRVPRDLPNLRILDGAEQLCITDIFSMKASDCELVNYTPWPRIEAPVSK